MLQRLPRLHRAGPSTSLDECVERAVYHMRGKCVKSLLPFHPPISVLSTQFVRRVLQDFKNALGEIVIG